MITREVPLDLVGGSSFDRYRKQSIESTFNMIISDNALVPFAGYQTVKEIAKAGTARELYVSSSYNHMIVVIGSAIYEISRQLSIARIGELKTARGDVYIAENNAGQIALVDGLAIYVYDYRTSTFTTVTKDAEGKDLPFQPVYISFLNGYFIIPDGKSNLYHLSDLNDGTQWRVGDENPDTTGALTTRPDVLKAVVIHPDIPRILVMGTSVTEIWSPFANESPTPIFPFARDNSLNINYGALNRATIATGFGMIVWVSTNEAAGPAIHAFSRSGIKAISTDGIDFVLGALTKPEDSSAFLFEEDGHVFYQITFPTDKVSFVYDFTTEKFFNVTDECLNAHIAKRVAFFNNKHYFVSNIDANLYEMGTNFTTLNGHVCPRVRITKPVRAPDSRRFVTTNVGLTIEQGNNALVQTGGMKHAATLQNTSQRVGLSVSKDGSDTFGNNDFIDLNSLGNRRNKLQWWQLGMANDLTMQFEFFSAARFVVTSGWVRIRQ